MQATTSNPVFTAYGAAPNPTNSNPMFACQYRGVVSINTEVPDNTGGAYCDYGADLSDTGEVILYHGELDWLADKGWHLYTVTLTPNKTIVYLDGEVANSWTLDGVSRGQCATSRHWRDLSIYVSEAIRHGTGAILTTGFGFGDIFLYNKVLSKNEIKQLMLLKK